MGQWKRVGGYGVRHDGTAGATKLGMRVSMWSGSHTPWFVHATLVADMGTRNGLKSTDHAVIEGPIAIHERFGKMVTENVLASGMKTKRSDPFRIRIPRRTIGRSSLGLGDIIAMATSAVGVKPCGGCKERAAYLNSLLMLEGVESASAKNDTYGEADPSRATPPQSRAGEFPAVDTQPEVGEPPIDGEEQGPSDVGQDLADRLRGILDRFSARPSETQAERAADCRRGCSCGLAVTAILGSGVVWQGSMLNINPQGKCGCNVPKRCRERARNRGMTCLRDAWAFAHVVQTPPPSCVGIDKYAVPHGGLKKWIVEDVLDTLNHPTTGMLYIDVTAVCGSGSGPGCADKQYLGRIKIDLPNKIVG
jgi:hypothetical protein